MRQPAGNRHYTDMRILHLCIWIGLAAASVPALWADQCNVSLNPSSSSPAAAAGNYSLAVTSTTDCTRVATSNNDWLTVSFGQTSGGKSSSVGYTVTENLTSQVRTGTITVAAQPPFTDAVVFTVKQAAANCNYAFTPAATITVPAKNVTAFLLGVNTRCVWTGTTTASWISISNGGPFTGNGSTVITVADNLTTSLRRGVIQINDQAVTIQQSGIVCAYSVTPASVSISAEAASVAFAVNTDPACSWTATSASSWILLSSPGLPGPGTVTAAISANVSPQPRTASVTIAGVQRSIAQAGVGISFTADAIQNASSFAGGPLSPGEIFVIYGSGLGPQTLATLQTTSDGKSITTSLAGTRILFDGIPAPMIYSSATQISGIVPYAAWGSLTHITVEYLGIPSAPVNVNMLPATPGIFTASQTGTGQGAILNQDFSVNSATNAATAGQALSIYWTGGGVLSRTVPDGQLVSATPPYPNITFPMTVTLGGVQAPVYYSGAVPTLAPGILQTTIVIPDNAPKGNAIPLLMTVGTFSTQNSVTVAIR